MRSAKKASMKASKSNGGVGRKELRKKQRIQKKQGKMQYYSKTKVFLPFSIGSLVRLIFLNWVTREIMAATKRRRSSSSSSSSSRTREGL